MIIYNKQSQPIIDITIDDDSYCYKAIMGEDAITLHFNLAEFVEFPIDSYCIFQGQNYYLNTPTNLKKEHSRNFEYTLILESEISKAKHKILVNPIDGRIKFEQCSKAIDHLNLVVENLNRSDIIGWSVGDCIEADEKLISYDCINCFEALKSIAEVFDTEYEIIDKTIHLRKVEYNLQTPLSLSYGKGNGFKSGVGRTIQSEKNLINILYVQGGDRNIDLSTYGQKYLHLPINQQLGYDGYHFSFESGYNSAKGTMYHTDNQGTRVLHPIFFSGNQNAPIFEDSFDGSEFYPKRIGRVSSVIKVDDNYDFIDNTIPQELNYEDYLLENGEVMNIIFQSGQLAGREFAIQKYIHSERKFQVVSENKDEVLMPSENFPISEGDTYIVINCTLPPSLICNNSDKSGAEWEMFKAAVKYLYEYDKPQYAFTGELDGIWARRYWGQISDKIVLGGVIAFSDNHFQVEPIFLRIKGIKQYINNPYSPEIELSESPIKVDRSIFTPDPKKIGGEIIDNDKDKYRQSKFIRDIRDFAIKLERTNTELAIEKLRIDNALNALNAIDNDTILTPLEKRTLQTEWGKINGSEGSSGSYRLTLDILSEIGYGNEDEPIIYTFGDFVLTYNGLKIAYNYNGVREFSEVYSRLADYISELCIYENSNTIGFNRSKLSSLISLYYDKQSTLLDLAERFYAVQTANKALNNFINGEYADDLENIKTQIDQKSETWIQDSDPSLLWTTNADKDLHLGDLWWNNSNTTINGVKSGESAIYTKVGATYKWEICPVPEMLFDRIDGKASIYTSKPTKYFANDIWIVENDTVHNDYDKGTILVATQDSDVYNAAHWLELVKYTQLANEAKQAAEEADAKAQAATNTANQAVTDAANAQNKANQAYTNAQTANNLLADISNDNKLTAEEKRKLKIEFDSIIKEYSENITLATTYSVNTANYTLAYNNLYSVVNPLLTNLDITSDCNGANIRTLFATYYEKRAILLNTITTKAKELADTAQQAADIADGKAVAAQTQLDNWANDGFISPFEKTSLKERKNDIIAEKIEICSNAEKYSINANNYITAYNNAITALDKYTNNAIENIVIEADYANIATYYTQRTIILQAIATAIDNKANAATNAANAASQALTTFINGDYATAIESISQQIDGKSETFVQSTNPATNWTTNADKEKHLGDIWWNNSNSEVASVPSGATAIYSKSGNNYIWKVAPVPQSVFDLIDGTANIFTTKPTKYNANDLWIVESDSVISGYKQGDILISTNSRNSYNASDWTKKVRYTDDTKADKAITDAKNAQDTADDVQSQIDSKVWIDDVNTAIGAAKSAIEEAQNLINTGFANDISSKVNSSDYTTAINGLNSAIGTANGSITALRTEIEAQLATLNNSKVGSDDYNNAIQYLENLIGGKVSSSDYNQQVQDFLDSLNDLQAGINATAQSINQVQTAINNINADDVLDPSEKRAIKIEFDKINQSYNSTLKLANVYGIDTTKVIENSFVFGTDTLNYNNETLTYNESYQIWINDLHNSYSALYGFIYSLQLDSDSDLMNFNRSEYTRLLTAYYFAENYIINRIQGIYSSEVSENFNEVNEAIDDINENIESAEYLKNAFNNSYLQTGLVLGEMLAVTDETHNVVKGIFNGSEFAKDADKGRLMFASGIDNTNDNLEDNAKIAKTRIYEDGTLISRKGVFDNSQINNAVVNQGTFIDITADGGNFDNISSNNATFTDAVISDAAITNASISGTISSGDGLKMTYGNQNVIIQNDTITNIINNYIGNVFSGNVTLPTAFISNSHQINVNGLTGGKRYTFNIQGTMIVEIPSFSYWFGPGGLGNGMTLASMTPQVKVSISAKSYSNSNVLQSSVIILPTNTIEGDIVFNPYSSEGIGGSVGTQQRTINYHTNDNSILCPIDGSIKLEITITATNSVRGDNTLIFGGTPRIQFNTTTSNSWISSGGEACTVIGIDGIVVAKGSNQIAITNSGNSLQIKMLGLPSSAGASGSGILYKDSNGFLKVS